MAFKEVADLSTEVTVSVGGTNRKTGKKNPDRVEGYYLGRRSVADTKKKSGVSYIYVLQTSKGNLGVWGKTDMDRKMDSVPLGTMIFIAFEKMVPTANGEMYKYKVGVDADNTIEVNTLPSGQTSQETTVTANDNFADADESYDDTTDEDEADAAQAAALAAAERKAKVQALLKGNKSAKN